MIFGRKQMLDIIAQHQSNIDKKAVNPVFASIRLQVSDGILTVSSLDGEHYLEHCVKCPGEFDVFLPGYNFYELLRKSTTADFEIEDAGENLLLRFGKAEFKFAKYAHKAFPEWTDSYDKEITVDAVQLRHALQLTRGAASNDEMRPYLNGVCLDARADCLNVCSTDGLRMALYKMPNEAQVEGSWIMSRKSVNDLVQLLEKSVDKITMKLGNNSCVRLDYDNHHVTWKSLLVAGKFPQYEKIIPQSCVGNLVIASKEFVEKLDRMMIMANVNQPVVTLILGDEVRITSSSALANGSDVLDGQYDGPAMSISFNARLLIEMLKSAGVDLNIGLNNPHSPVLITSEVKDALFMLAPVKRDN